MWGVRAKGLSLASGRPGEQQGGVWGTPLDPSSPSHVPSGAVLGAHAPRPPCPSQTWLPGWQPGSLAQFPPSPSPRLSGRNNSSGHLLPLQKGHSASETSRFPSSLPLWAGPRGYGQGGHRIVWHPGEEPGLLSVPVMPTPNPAAAPKGQFLTFLLNSLVTFEESHIQITLARTWGLSHQSCRRPTCSLQTEPALLLNRIPEH